MMREPETHLTDEELLLFADGESHGRDAANSRDHLAACWSCRLRLRELDDAIAEVARMHRQAMNPPLPPPEGPRALLRARLREMGASGAPSAERVTFNRFLRMGAVFGTVAGVIAIIWIGASTNELDAVPRSDLTPGAVRSRQAMDVCNAELSGNARVVPAVQQQVFAEYGMRDAEARAYEVDYLITPALGGSDDIRNLWPQPYSGSPWNAYVKDALEDHLRGMVCGGELDLATAQREIAVNWIAAYKKYFHTRRPLPQHQRLRREDRAD